MSIFKSSLIIKTKQKYKGNKKNIDLIFKIYSTLVETLPIDFDIVSSFDSMSLDFKKHLVIDEVLVKKIKSQIFSIKEIMDDIPNFEDVPLILKIQRISTYKYLVKNLIEFMGTIFNNLGIQTKLVKVKSNRTGILVPTFVTDLTNTEQYIEEQILLNQILSDKTFRRIKNDLEKEGISLSQEEEKTYALKKNGETVGYINRLLPEKIFKNLDALNEFLNQKEIIDNKYDQLILGDDGELYTEDDTLVTKIDTIPYDDIEEEIKKYDLKIEAYNQKLLPYETKLSNKARTIILGDHNLKVKNIIHKNVIRPVIIEGPFEGVFLDQMVSSTGKVLGSSSVASPYFIENRQQIEMIGDATKLKVKDIFKMKHSVVSQRIKSYKPKKQIGDIISKSTIDGIDYQTTLEQTIEKINDNTTVLKQSNLDLSKISQLGGFNILSDIRNPNIEIKYQHSIEDSFYTSRKVVKDIFRINTNNLNPNIQLNRTLYFEDHIPKEIHNDIFIANSCIPDGLGIRIFTQQVKTAAESKFPTITTLAARSETLVGYHIWPKMGYGGKIDLSYLFSKDYKTRQIEKKKFFSKKSSEYGSIHPKAVPLLKWLDERNLLTEEIDFGERSYSTNILNIYAYKVGDRFVGQELWKEFGDSVDLTFDLSEGSLSRRILDSYVTLKAQKEGIPVEDFVNIDYSRYSTQRSLTCLLERYLSGKNVENMREALLVAIKNEENGEIIEFLSHPKIEDFLRDFSKNGIITTEIKESLKEIAVKNQISFSNIKLGSNFNKKPKQNDPLFRGLDMGILNKIWDEISKIYN